MGYLPIHIYGYNNEHDVIVYTVINDTHSQCGQPRHRFQKSPFWSVYTETLPRALECDQFSHTCDLNSQGCDKKKSEVALVRPAIRKKKKKKSPQLRKSLCCSTTDTLGSYHGLNQSEIVKGGPPL